MLFFCNGPNGHSLIDHIYYMLVQATIIQNRRLKVKQWILSSAWENLKSGQVKLKFDTYRLVGPLHVTKSCLCDWCEWIGNIIYTILYAKFYNHNIYKLNSISNNIRGDFFFKKKMLHRCGSNVWTKAPIPLWDREYVMVSVNGPTSPLLFFLFYFFGSN